MIEKGNVVEILGDGRVVVEVNRQEACASCSAKSACNPGNGRTHKAVANSNIVVGIGDTVEIEIADGAMARAVLWAYLVPCALMLAGIFITWFALNGSTLDARKDLIAAFGGLAGAALGFLFMRIVNNRIRRPGTRANARFSIDVVRIVQDDCGDVAIPG